MKTCNIFGILAIFILTLSFPAWAGNGAASGSGSGSATTVTTSSESEDEDSDRPDYAVPGSGNENKPGTGNAEPGVSKGDLYGDLYIIVRNENGEPILFEWFDDNGNPVDPYVSANGYVQPIASDECSGLPEYDSTADGAYLPLVPLDIEGEIPEAYAECAQEVEFGRLNVARAPQTFFDRAYEEAINNINGAVEVSFDASGRLLLLKEDPETGEIIEKAVDAPRENLAMYQKLMIYGHLPGVTGNNFQTEDVTFLDDLLSPSDPTEKEALSDNDLKQAAAFLAAAADKTGSINVDMVIYLNAILGLNGDDGTDFFNFLGVHHQRSVRHGKPEAEVIMGPYEYDLNSLKVLENGRSKADIDKVGTPRNRHCFVIAKVNIMDEIFTGVDANAYDARGFAKAADDALKVINYIHNWAVPEYDE